MPLCIPRGLTTASYVQVLNANYVLLFAFLLRLVLLSSPLLLSSWSPPKPPSTLQGRSSCFPRLPLMEPDTDLVEKAKYGTLVCSIII